MENLDDYLEGTFNPDNPANQKEETGIKECRNAIEAFTQYEFLKSPASKTHLLGCLAQDMAEAEKFREAKLTMERLTAWKKIRFDLYAKVDDSEPTRIEIQNAIDKIKMLKKKLCEILR